MNILDPMQACSEMTLREIGDMIAEEHGESYRREGLDKWFTQLLKEVAESIKD